MKRHLRKAMASAMAVMLAVTAVPVAPAQAAAKLSLSTCVISKGDKLDLDVDGADEKTGKYSSSKKTVASVTKTGVITARKTGNATITWKKGGKKYTCKVKVVKAPSVSRPKIELPAKQSETISVLKYSNKNLTVKWSSSDSKIAKVKGGKVTGVAEGHATIKARIKGYQKTWTKEIDVTIDNSSHKGYLLKWEDQFNGSSLNRKDWNVELHEPGWVNAEWQEYVDSDENIYVKDGKLVLKPVKKTVGGKDVYTSGRVNTQGKHDFKYGFFEARAKVPAGKGYLPAFWMMPTNENLYGQWPRCGEIDIMEVMGQETDKLYGTVHYGEPHAESQGTEKLTQGNFSDEYHIFGCEWEPGRIRWYVDGKLYHEEKDWFSATAGQGTITYPAPFDQPFYMILNLAVGGSWVGYPDETTDFENQAFVIDWVKAYQKDSYDESGVKKPEKPPVVLRDPDKDGNYANNGNFAKKENLNDDTDWQFMTALEGEAAAEIVDDSKIGGSAIKIATTNKGTVDYSVQLVQHKIPLQQGGKYKLTFDAYAEKDRTMFAGVGAIDDRSWKKYVNSEINLTTEKQTFTSTFDMTDEDYASARIEFNMGNVDPAATIYISNVKLEKTGTFKIDNSKTVLADGNYVYNGSFQEGKDRMEYWETSSKTKAKISVTNKDNARKLKITAPEGTSSKKPVVVSQKKLALSAKSPYAVSFLAKGKKGSSIKVSIAGKSYKAALTGKEKEYAFKFTTKASLPDKNIVFRIESPGTYYLDDVRVVDDSLIKNGSFNAGLAGYEPYIDSSANASYVVDSLTEDNALDFTISDTGDAAWKIQLKQNNIELKKGQWYKLSLDAKSDLARKIMFAIQRDGSSDDDWTPYSGEKIVELTNKYQTFEIVFQMKNKTDLKSILSISMGAVDGKQITEKHRICIDNIRLDKIDAPAT